MKPPADNNALLAMCGISHHTATLSEREEFQVLRQDLVPALKELMSIRGVREAMILSTCNRFETYLLLDEGEEDFSVIRDFFKRIKGIDPKPKRKLFYVHHGSTVARHLFRVTAGMDSMILGEYQIQNQVKEAYSAACSVKAPGKVLHRLMHATFRAGKSIRTHTAVGAGRMSVAGMAVKVFKERLFSKDTILIIGANENTRIVADGLKTCGLQRLLFANRTPYKADKMAVRYGGEGFGLEMLPELLGKSAGVLSCTGSNDFVIEASLLNELVESDRCPKLLIDIAVPRDIERPETPDFPAKIVDLEDLRSFRDEQLDIRKEDVPKAMRIIEDMVTTFQSWMEGAFDPGVGALVKEFERIRQVCLASARATVSEEDREALEDFSRNMMQEFLKVPFRSIIENAPPRPSHKDR